MIRAALALLFIGCAHPAPPSGYADLHNSSLRWLLDASHTAIAQQVDEWTAANSQLLVLSLGQASFPLGTTDTTSPSAVPALMNRAHRLLANGPRWIAAIEGGSLLSSNPDHLQQLWDSSVRIVGVGHHRHDQWIEPARPTSLPGPSAVDDHSRLSPAGQHLIEQLHAAGFIVDLAHLGATAFAETAAIVGSRPLLVSHTGARALCDTPRNLSDAQARQVARSGGLVGVIFHSPLLRCGETSSTVVAVAKHIEHFVQVMGPTHVALGTDWRGRTRPPNKLQKPADLGRLEEMLARRGMAAATIQGVLYGNAVRWLTRNAGAP